MPAPAACSSRKDADTAVPPASMSKLMTMIMVFEALKAGKLTLDQQFIDQRGCLAARRCVLGRLHHVCRAQFVGQAEDLIKGVDRAVRQ